MCLNPSVAYAEPRGEARYTLWDDGMRELGQDPVEGEYAPRRKLILNGFRVAAK